MKGDMITMKGNTPSPAGVNTKLSGMLTILYHVLLIIGLALILFITGGTIYGLIFRTASAHPLYTIPAAPVSGADPSQRQITAPRDGIFTGIGRLRVVTADQPPVTVIVSIAFPYVPEDRPFTEELAAKIPDFRNAVSEYFSAHTSEELRELEEEVIKAELLRRYNRMLHLGTIETLYFNDLMFIE